MKEVKAYKCDFCHRCFGRIVDATNHEKRCKGNPAMRSCITCVHGVSAIVRYDSWEDGLEVAAYGPWCKHLNMDIGCKPYFEECDTASRYGVTGDEPMPGTCWNYEYKGYAGWPKEPPELLQNTQQLEEVE